MIGITGICASLGGYFAGVSTAAFNLNSRFNTLGGSIMEIGLVILLAAAALYMCPFGRPRMREEQTARAP